MPCWVVMRQVEPVCVTFTEAEAARIVEKDRFLHYVPVSYGRHPSAEMLVFQVQQTSVWKHRAKSYESKLAAMIEDFELMEEELSRLKKRLDFFQDLD